MFAFAEKNTWRVLDSTGNTILVLFKSQATLNSVTYYPGDMIIKGAVSGQSTPLTGAYVWRLKNASEAVMAQLTPAGNLQLRYDTGQTNVSDKVKTYASFPLTTSIASDRFRYDASDLDFIANKGDEHTVFAAGNTRPTSTSITGTYPYVYDTMESYHGSGDLWVTTWVANDPSSGNPVLLMANGDGYGLSFRPKAGPNYLAYQKDQGDSLVIYPYYEDWFTSPCWRLLPTIAISKFDGRPGEGNGTGTSYLGWPFGDPLSGPGETIARFLCSNDPVGTDGEFPSGHNMATNKIPNEPPGLQGAGVYKNSEGIDSHSHRTPRELKPTGLIHFDDGSTSGATYLACQDHNPNYPEEIEDCPDSKYWQPTAAAQHVYIFKSTDGGTSWTAYVSDGADYLPRLNLASSRVWTDFKFTTPAFCQFGMAYGDYPYAFPGETTKYLYAFSPHERWWNQDNLYLGRAKVYDSTSGGWQTDNILSAGNWSYWVGTDSGG